MSEHEQRILQAVDYALRSGCFFPVRQPKLTAPVQAWVKWGAMRHLHDALAEAHRETGQIVVRRTVESL